MPAHQTPTGVVLTPERRLALLQWAVKVSGVVIEDDYDSEFRFCAGRSDRAGDPFNVPPTFASTYRDGGAVGYGRWGNPSWTAFETALGALEGGAALAFASGQSAIAAVLETLPMGAEVVFPADAYLGTRQFLADVATRGRFVCRGIDATNTAEAISALKSADLLWLESPTNPMLGVVDLAPVLGAANSNGVLSVVDNTFATPLLQKPLDLGATAVIHSASKFIGGHSDLLLGCIVTRDEDLRQRLHSRRTLHGGIPGTMEAYLALRGLRTLALRLRQGQASAQRLAERLADHRLVTRVRYPGLVTDQWHVRASKQMSGFGALISFEVADADTADRLVDGLRLIVGGTSLGGVESTIDRRNRWPGEENVPAGLLRLSVGIEDCDDLWNDLKSALQ